MDVLMKAYVDRMLAGEKNISIEQIYEENMYTFLTLYDKLKDLLEDQELLAPLMQLTFGPVQTATREDINILCGYGIFVPAGPDREKRKIFSESFRDYLFMLQESVEFAPLEQNRAWHEKCLYKDDVQKIWEKLAERAEK